MFLAAKMRQFWIFAMFFRMLGTLVDMKTVKVKWYVFIKS